MIHTYTTRYAPPDVWFARWSGLKHTSEVFDDTRMMADVAELLKMVNLLHLQNPSKRKSPDARRLWWADIWRELGSNGLSVFSLLEYAKNSVQEKSTYPAIETADVAIADSEKKYYKEGHKKASKFCEAICALAAYVKQLNPRCIETVYNLGDRLSLAKAGTLREYWSETELGGSLLDGYQQQLAFSTHSQLRRHLCVLRLMTFTRGCQLVFLMKPRQVRQPPVRCNSHSKKLRSNSSRRRVKNGPLTTSLTLQLRALRAFQVRVLFNSLKAAVRDAACPPGQLPKTWRKVVLGFGFVETSRAERVTQHVLGVFHAYARAEEEA